MKKKIAGMIFFALVITTRALLTTFVCMAADDDMPVRDAADQTGTMQDADVRMSEALSSEMACFEEKDGEYTIEVSLVGGTGSAAISSPALLTITYHKCVVRLEWSSPNYDYMIVNGEKLDPVNAEGNSVFEVPVYVLDQEMMVTADTTAMSVPHEIEYMLIFHSDTVKHPGTDILMYVGVIAVLVIAGVAVLIVRTKKKV